MLIRSFENPPYILFVRTGARRAPQRLIYGPEKFVTRTGLGERRDSDGDAQDSDGDSESASLLMQAGILSPVCVCVCVCVFAPYA